MRRERPLPGRSQSNLRWAHSIPVFPVNAFRCRRLRPKQWFTPVMTKDHRIARRDHLRRRVRVLAVGATGLAGAASVALTFVLAGPASQQAQATARATTATTTSPAGPA